MIPDFRETATRLDLKKGLMIGGANPRPIAENCAKTFGAEGAGAEIRRMPSGPLANQFASRSPAIDKLLETASALDAAKLITGDTILVDGGTHIIDGRGDARRLKFKERREIWT